MASIEQAKERLEKIKNTDFSVSEVKFYGKIHRRCNLLREVLLCYESFYYLHEKEKEYEEALDDIMEDKFRSLNPDLSEEVIHAMTYSYKRSDIICPMDIMVIDGLVFNKEAVCYEGGRDIQKIKTYMFNEVNGFFDVLNEWFVLEAYLHNKKNDLTDEEEKNTVNILSYNINNVYGSNIVKPANKEYSSVATKLLGYDNHPVIISLNMSFLDYGKALRDKEECDLKLCFKDGDDITMYYIHQSFKDADPVWIVTGSSKEVWTLTEAIEKQKDNSHTLIKK